jgi:hypothetical protein
MLNLKIMPLELKLSFDARILFQAQNLTSLHNKQRKTCSLNPFQQSGDKIGSVLEKVWSLMLWLN